MIKWKRHKVVSCSADGVLSVNAQRKLRGAMRWLIACSSVKTVYEKKKGGFVPWRVNMCTLTFKKNMQDDDEARRLLSMLLDNAFHKWGVERYVWKAEAQERGAIHFHLCTNVYIPHEELCYSWNRLLYRNGIRQVNANSTDVHAVTDEYNVEAYLTDYLLNSEKAKGRRLIQGRLWGCDRKLSQAGKFSLHTSFYERESLVNDPDLNMLNGNVDLPFLKFVDYYIMNEQRWQSMQDCEIKALYMAELDKLKPTVDLGIFW